MQPAGTPWLLRQGRERACGHLGQALLPSEQRSGDGPRRTGCSGELAGMGGASRSAGHALCAAGYGIPLSPGAHQKMVERVSTALGPHDDTLGQGARTAAVHAIDETSWHGHGD
jgi:hypothetical protein